MRIVPVCHVQNAALGKPSNGVFSLQRQDESSDTNVRAAEIIISGGLARMSRRRGRPRKPKIIHRIIVYPKLVGAGSPPKPKHEPDDIVSMPCFYCREQVEMKYSSYLKKRNQPAYWTVCKDCRKRKRKELRKKQRVQREQADVLAKIVRNRILKDTRG